MQFLNDPRLSAEFIICVIDWLFIYLSTVRPEEWFSWHIFIKSLIRSVPNFLNAVSVTSSVRVASLDLYAHNFRHSGRTTLPVKHCIVTFPPTGLAKRIRTKETRSNQGNPSETIEVTNQGSYGKIQQIRNNGFRLLRYSRRYGTIVFFSATLKHGGCLYRMPLQKAKVSLFKSQRSGDVSYDKITRCSFI